MPQAANQQAMTTGIYGFTALADSEWARRIELAREPDPDGPGGPGVVWPGRLAVTGGPGGAVSPCPSRGKGWQLKWWVG